jgi:hypothetical protein
VLLACKELRDFFQIYGLSLRVSLKGKTLVKFLFFSQSFWLYESYSFQLFCSILRDNWMAVAQLGNVEHSIWWSDSISNVNRL